MANAVHNQDEMQRHLPGGDLHDWYFDDRYPIWKCPVCGSLNRYGDTWGEQCWDCRTDRTPDWEQFIVDPEVKADWV